MIGEVEAFLDEGIDIDEPVFARAFARVQQHVLDDGIGTLAVLHDLVEIAPQRIRQFVNLSSRFIVERYALERCPAIHQSIRQRRQRNC